jgi:hypothetical protein
MLNIKTWEAQESMLCIEEAPVWAFFLLAMPTYLFTPFVVLLYNAKRTSGQEWFIPQPAFSYR